MTAIVTQLADCEDTLLLQGVQTELLDVTAAITRMLPRFASWHARDAVARIAEELGDHVKYIEVVANDCAERERDERENAAALAAHDQQDQWRNAA